jgi:Ca2+-binding EF-hand superfamily protein
MGSQFSSGFVPSELRQHVERPLARVKVLFDAFKRLCRDEFQNNAMFITRDQFQRVFDMDVEEAHRHFGYWDRARRGRVSSVELWGAMALCCAEREEVKINFCFCELLDLDKDGALNEVELRLLLQSVSTGVARLKQIRAPPPDLIDGVVQAAFDQAIKTEDELALQGKMDLYNFGMYLKGDDELQKYLASLEREDSGDSEELYKQQADLLLELSKLDTRLDEIDDERARAEHDKQLYEDERGGDVRKELVVGLRGLYDEASSDDEVEVLLGDGEARLASAARKKAKESGRAMVIESEKTFVTTGEPVQIENRLLAKEYASKQTTTYYKNEAKRRKALERERALKVEGGLAYSKNRKEKQEAPTSPPRQASKLNAQMERRARRKKALGPRAGDDGGDIFKRLARKPAKALVGSDKDDKEKAMLLHKWRTFDQGIDELVRLDVDLFEDLFEALAVFITDDEAEAALRDMPCNSVGAYSLDAVLEWHRNRHVSEPTGNEAILAAKTKLETIKDWVNKAGSTLRRWSTNVRSRLAAKREEMRARAVVAVEEEESEEDESDSDESEADTATTASHSVKLPIVTGPEEVVPGLRGQAPQATFDDPKQLVSPAKSEQSYKPEPTQPCAGNASLKIGEGDDPKIQEPKASLKFALLRTPRPQLGLGGRSGPDALNDAIDQGLNDTRKLDVSAAELISVDYRRALQSFQGEQPSAKEQKSPVKQQRPTTAASPRRPRTGVDDWDPNGPEPARSVFWVDLPIDKDVSVEKVVSVSREIEATARIIPRDYAKQYFDRVRCDVVVAQLPMKSKGKRKGVSGQKVEKPVLRVQVFSRHDPLQIVESSLPEDSRPSQVLGTITGVCDFNHTLAELAHEAAKYHDLAPRLWGPQENELGERADPTSFRERIRLLRKQLHDDAESVDAMDQNELRDRLEQEGHASTGAFARGRSADGKEKQPGKVARERLRAVLYRKAARLGYGELSDFGSKVAASIFRRFDPDKSGGMDFDEFAAMSRELGELAPADSAEYKKSLSSSDVHLKTEEHVDPNTHMKRVKVMGVSVEGFVARYARKGSLGTDAALLGCGSLDDQIQLISSMQLELDADAAGRVEAALVAHARTMHQDRIRSWWPLRTFFPQPSQQRRAALLEWLAFFLKFSKGCFIERTASRLSDVLGKDTAPDWLTSPGYLFYAIHQLREVLARGDEGIIPLFRNALQAQFGGRWTSLHEDLGSLHETVPVRDMVEDPLGIQKQLAEDDQVFNAMAGVSGVGRFDSRREKVQDLTGFSHVNVMRIAAKASDIQLRGIPEPTEEELERAAEQAEIRAAQAAISPARSTTSQASDLGEEHDVSLYDEAFERLLLGEEKFPPPPEEDDVVVVGGLSANDPTAEEAQADEKEESLRAHGSNPFCDEGALLHCSHLQTEVDDCESALQRENIPPYARESLERRRDARIRELACYNEAFERREVLALARALRSYDGLRDIAAGPCAFGFGTHTRTVRGELDGFLDTVRLGRLLPAGMGEAASLELHEAQENRRATDRLLEAQRRILHEKELMRKAAEVAAQRAITAEKRRIRRRFVEEVRLYGRGEKYMREALFYATKYGPTDSVADRKRLEAE